MTDEPEKLAAKVIVLSTPSSPNADLVMNLSRPSGIRLWGPVEPAPGLDINSNIRLMDEITEASRRALVRIMGVPSVLSKIPIHQCFKSVIPSLNQGFATLPRSVKRSCMSTSWRGCERSTYTATKGANLNAATPINTTEGLSRDRTCRPPNRRAVCSPHDVA
jgi:hypothetical protein